MGLLPPRQPSFSFSVALLTVELPAEFASPTNINQRRVTGTLHDGTAIDACNEMFVASGAAATARLALHPDPV